MPTDKNETTLSIATELMRKDLGVWDCKWEFLDAEEQVADSTTGVQTSRFVVDELIQQIEMDVPDMEIKSIGLRYFNPTTEMIHWVTVDNKGDQWTFIEPLDGGVSESLPHENPDGTTTRLRFSPLRKSDDEIHVQMEQTEDNENWRPIFRMARTRRSE